MPPRLSRELPPPVAVLDSESLSVLASPKERGTSARRAQAVLAAVERRGGTACVPAPVLAEVSRTAARSAAVARILSHARVTPTDRSVAEEAGRLLGRLQLDSSHAIDAFVVATAAALGNAVILTGDPDDLRRLANNSIAVTIQALP